MLNFKINSITICESCSKELRKNLQPGIYKFDDDLPYSFFGKNISIYAIVGKNGSGKSSLIEILFRIVNNFGFYLVNGKDKKNSADNIYLIPGLYAILDYTVNGILCNICCENEDVTAVMGENKYFFSESGNTKNGFENCTNSNYNKKIEIAKQFFYTIVTNYSLQSYNSKDYAHEKSMTYRSYKSQGAYSRGVWIEGLFHKNDGYMVPITLNPYRDKGVFDLNLETGLTNSRLSAILVEAKKKKREFIDGYQLSKISYRLDYQGIIDKFKGTKFYIVDPQDFCLKLISHFGCMDKYVPNNRFNAILDAYGVDKGDMYEVKFYACLYLVYKTLSIAGKYPSYCEFSQLCDLNLLDDISKSYENKLMLTRLVDAIENDNSHITTKIKQVLHFLKALNASNNFFPKCINYMNLKFSYDEYELFLGIEKKNTSLEARLEIMPPPIFSAEIWLERKVGGTYNSKEPILFYELSSGERQFLFMMSTLIYHVLNIKSIPTNRIHYRNISIVLDEVEICFHPEYQRTFIFKLIKMIQALHLNTHCSFNILITTHSPFILSDIPKNNILCLEDGSVCQNAMSNPFAANINDILKQNFFLEGGFMGEFVKNKILSLVEYITRNTNKREWNSQTARTFIESIGEPLLKQQLSYLLDDKEKK